MGHGNQMSAEQNNRKFGMSAPEAMGDVNSGVGRVARGFSFLYLDINAGGINILPNWAGYFLLWKAAKRLGQKESEFLSLKPLALLLAVYDGACWLMSLFGVRISVMAATVIIGVVSLYFEYQFLTTLGHLAARWGAPRRKWFYRLRIYRAAMMTLLLVCRISATVRAGGWYEWIARGLLAVSLVMMAATGMAVGDLERAMKTSVSGEA